MCDVMDSISPESFMDPFYLGLVESSTMHVPGGMFPRGSFVSPPSVWVLRAYLSAVLAFQCAATSAGTICARPLVAGGTPIGLGSCEIMRKSRTFEF